MKHLILLLVLIGVSMSAWTQNEISGEQLHDEFCVSCHTSDIYTRDHRIVNNYMELQERVRQCELANDYTWFDKEIEAVISYLNNSYYQFETQ